MKLWVSEFFLNERVMKTFSQRPCRCFGEVICCVMSKDARISFNVVFVADGVSKISIKQCKIMGAYIVESLADI